MSVSIINADVMDGLARLPDGSVHTVVTSPPYWGLRDYHAAGQIGLEPTFGEHLAVLVRVFAEIRRVLRDDGTVWLNYGDAYAGSWGAQSRGDDYPGRLEGGSTLSARQIRAHPQGQSGTGSLKRTPGLKPKDLMLMPERLAIALQEDGWWIRSRIIWAKPNPMPESVTDRPTKSHEHIWLLSKSERYYYDAEAIRERADSQPSKMPDGWDTGPGAHGSRHRNGRQKGASISIGAKGNANGFRGGSYVNGEAGPRTRTGNIKAGKNETEPEHRTRSGFNARWDDAEAANAIPPSRNCRDVWTIAAAPFREAHFATFPPEIAARCIKAGSSEKGCCAACGTPLVRQVDITTGWSASCGCAKTIVPCTVLDPFLGAGTTAMVADRMQRHVIGIEINPDYVAMSNERITRDRGGLIEIMESAP